MIKILKLYKMWFLNFVKTLIIALFFCLGVVLHLAIFPVLWTDAAKLIADVYFEFVCDLVERCGDV